jgi:hypothetical protein
MKPVLKRFFPRLLFALLLLAGSGMSRISAGLHAQNTIGFSLFGFSGMPDTVYAGDTIPVGAFFKNFGVTSYNPSDTFEIRGSIDTLSGPPILFSFPPDTTSLAPGDSTFVIFPIDFRDNHMGGNFKIGNNIIVVWPISYNQTWGTHDSLTATVFVIDTINGIGPELSPYEGVRCYPVPASGPMYITSNNPSMRPKEVIIRSATGDVVFVSKTPSFGIETESWANGVYFLEVTFDNGSRRVYKVVK